MYIIEVFTHCKLTKGLIMSTYKQLNFISHIAFLMLTLTIMLPTGVLAEEVNTPNSVKISVTLDPALQSKLNPNDTLFVYARAAQGSRMPLAVVRKTAGDLPLETQLDASMGMMPQMSMNNFPQIVLLARISASGNAIPQAGDLIGETGVIEWQKLDKSVAIVINKLH